MDEQQSRNIAQSLLLALSAENVQTILSTDGFDYWFDKPSNWQPYGNRSKNWDTVGNQQANAIGALVELITNGTDAILLRKAREAGILDFRGEDAPQSMFEAVKRFFPQVVEGRIANLSATQRTQLAEECVQIGVKRADRKNGRYPTYTVIDTGEGQEPDDFPKTFLSLSERNKEGVPFVQGKFNMGSTGSLRFCTKADITLGHYKFIVSKRPGSKYWGWTLIRVRSPRQGEGLPVTEYFCPGGQIPMFRADQLSAFDHSTLGLIKEGTAVKLYEFDVGSPANQVDIGLDNALTVNLIDCPLPIRIYDFDAKPQESKGELRKQGIAARTFSGMNVTLVADTDGTDDADAGPKGGSSETEWQQTILEEKGELGHIRIVATGIKKLRDSLEKHPARVFYTVNGQTHAFERASFLGSTKVALGDLRNHLIVNVICDRMDKTALANIFMPDRERKVNNNQSRQLEEMVINALHGDPRLRTYAAEIRMRRANELVQETAESKELLQELVDTDPAIQELFGLGTILVEKTKAHGDKEKYAGKQFPTILNPLNLKVIDGQFVKDVPINTYRQIECGTDAENEYLSRLESPGETWCSLQPDQMPHTVKLNNGTATFTIKVPKTAKVGESCFAEFGFVDNGPNIQPLKFGVLIRWTEAEEKKQGKKGNKKDNMQDEEKKSLALPKFEWVQEQGWSEHNFNEDSGAYVSVSEQTTVFVNHDCKSLRLMRAREKDDAARKVYEAMFRYGLGIFALSIHRKTTNADTTDSQEQVQSTVPQDPDEMVRLATAGIAPHIITVIKRLGGGELFG